MDGCMIANFCISNPFPSPSFGSKEAPCCTWQAQSIMPLTGEPCGMLDAGCWMLDATHLLRTASTSARGRGVGLSETVSRGWLGLFPQSGRCIQLEPERRGERQEICKSTCGSLCTCVPLRFPPVGNDNSTGEREQSEKCTQLAGAIFTSYSPGLLILIWIDRDWMRYRRHAACDHA